MVDADFKKFAAKKQWDKLIDSNQLCKELRNGHVFEGWKEGVIEFPPTYKYEINSKHIGWRKSKRRGEEEVSSMVSSNLHGPACLDHGQPPGGDVASIADAASVRPNVVFTVRS